MRPVRLALALVVLVAVGLLPASALAFPLTTCTLSITSLAADGTVLGTAISGADDSTRQDPFPVDWQGTIQWEGTTGGIVFTDFTYALDISGIPTPLRGSVINTSGATTGSGSVVPADVVPLELVGLFFLSGRATNADGQSCEGSGWIKLEGNPFITVQFWAGAALLAFGLALTLIGRGGRWLLGLIGGLSLGIGAAILLITFSFMPLGELTPLAALVVGVLVGLATSIGTRSRSSSSASGQASPAVETYEAPPD